MANALQTWASRQRAPATLILAALIGGAALLGALTRGTAVASFAMVNPSLRPWGLLTYPFAIDPLGSSFGIISLIFLVMLLLNFGATVEGEMGTGRFVLFWLFFTLLPALLALAMGFALIGPWLPSAALVVAWCARNRSARVMLYGIVPISGVWLAGLVTAMVLVSYGMTNPVAGIGMILPLGVAWTFASDMLPVLFRGGTAARKAKLTVVRGATSYDDRYFEDVKKREIEREERERLRKLFEGK